jgi:hypothetical protein
MVDLRHIGNSQVFMTDHVVGLRQPARFLVVEVAPLASGVLARIGH